MRMRMEGRVEDDVWGEALFFSSSFLFLVGRTTGNCSAIVTIPLFSFEVLRKSIKRNRVAKHY